MDVTHIVPFGRDVSEGETSLTSGLMAGKRGIVNNNAAYDMKSLGKHIEAVSVLIRLVARPLLIYK
jgi:dynamin 1-like protein